MNASLLVWLLWASAAGAAGQTADPRDGRLYSTIRLGDREWFAENLAYRTPASRCHGEQEVNCARYGRLYTHDEALQACPAGWRLASEEDWQALERWLGLPEAGLTQTRGRGPGLGDRLKRGGDTGFGALFGGYIDPFEGDKSIHLGQTAAFWASTPAGRDAQTPLAWHRDLAAHRSVIWRSPVNVTYWLSVRCVRG